MKIGDRSSELQNIITLHREAQEASHQNREAHSWLQKGHPLGAPSMEVDAFSLPSIIGNNFCDGKAFGEMEFARCLHYFSQFIKQIHENPLLVPQSTISKLNNLRVLMEEAAKFCLEFEQLIVKEMPPKPDKKGGGDWPLNQLCYKLVERLREKKELWIPLSWTDKQESPRALLVRVRQEGSVTFFQAGDPENLSQQFTTIRDVNKERLENPMFFKVLLEIVCRQRWHNNFFMNESTIIAPLEKYLQGKAQASVDSDGHPRVAKKPGRSHFPITKTVTSLICTYVDDPAEFKKLKFLWQTQALAAYQGPFNEYIKEVTENNLRAIDKIDLPTSYIEAFRATADDVLFRVSQTHQELPEKLVPLRVEASQKDQQFRFLIPPPIKRDSPASLSDVIQRRGNLVKSLLEQYQFLPPVPLSPKGDQIYNYLKSLLKVAKAHHSDCPALNRLCFNQLAARVLALPHPCQEPRSFWKEVDESKRDSCMEMVHGLMRRVIKMSEPMDEVNNAIILYKLFGINCEMAKNTVESMWPEFCPHPGGLLHYVKFGVNIVVELPYQQQWVKLMQYFYPGHTIASFDMEENQLFQMEHPGIALEYSFSKDENKNVTSKFLSAVLDRILEDPLKKERFYQKARYIEVDADRQSPSRPLDDSCSRPQKMACLLAEALNDESLLPHSLHYLLQSTLLVLVHRHHDKHILSLQPNPIQLKAITEVSSNGFRIKVTVPGSGYDHYRKPYRHSPGELYPSSPNPVIHGEGKVLDQTIDISREYLLLASDPYDEVARTFAFMKKHPYLLKEKSVQVVIKAHIFRFGRLLSQKHDNAQVIIEGMGIIKRVMSDFIHLNDQDTALFLFRMGMSLAHFVTEPSHQESFRRLLLEKAVLRFEKAPCYLALVEAHVRTMEGLLHDLAVDLYSYLFFQQSTHAERAVEAEQLLYFLMPSLPSLPCNPFLNDLFRRFLPGYEEQEWEGEFPCFRSKNYRVDLLNVTIATVEGDLYTTFPDEIYKNPLFRKIFKGKVATCTASPSGNIITVNQGMENELRIDPQTMTFMRKIEGRECQYINTPSHYYWSRLQKETVECWMDKDVHKPPGETNSFYHLHFLENGQRLIGRAMINPCETLVHYEHRSIHLPNKGRLVYMPDLPPSIIAMEKNEEKTIEEWMGNLEYWVGENGELSELRLASSSLTFFGKTVEGQRRIYSRDYPGYHLVENIPVPAAMKKYLTMQNHSGHCKVICFGGFVVEFDVVDGVLRSNQPLGQLMLILLLSVTGEYTEALEHLHQIVLVKHIKDYPRCLMLVQGAFELLASKDRHPMAAAVLLHLVALIEKNNLRYSKKEKDLEEAIIGRDTPPVVADIYDVYRRNIKNLKGFLLTEDQERFICEHVSWYKEGPLFKRIATACRESRSLRQGDLSAAFSQLFRNRNKRTTIHERIIKKGSTFFRQFFTLYQYAIKDNEKFKMFLDLNIAQADSLYYKCLVRIAAAPDKFPREITQENLDLLFTLLETKETLLDKIKSRFYRQPRPKTPPRQHSYLDFFDHHDHPKRIAPFSFTRILLDRDDEAYASLFRHYVEEFFVAEQHAVVVDEEALPLEHPDPNVRRKLIDENEELRYFRSTLSTTEIRYKLVPGRTLEDLGRLLNDKARALSQTLKTAKAALSWMTPWRQLQKDTLSGTANATANLGTAEYLVHSTRLHQMKRLVQIIEKSGEKNIPQLVNLLLLQRAYSPSTDSLEDLWFEEGNGFFIRRNQLEKLEEITPAGKSLVLAEIPTGDGKTKAYIPKLNRKKGSGDVLIFNTWPSSLEITNTMDIKQIMEQSFGQRVDRIVFNRATPITVRTLSYLYQDLLRNKQTGTAVSLKSESLRALQLHTILFLCKQSGYEMEIGLMLSILRLTRMSGWSTIDEAHLTLDPLDKLIYTMGEPEIMPVVHALLIQDFVDFLTEGPLKEMLKIEQNLHENFPKDRYKTEVVPLLIDYFAKKFSVTSNAFQQFLEGDLNAIPAENRTLMALAKGLVLQLLEPALGGPVNGGYGLSKLHIQFIEFAIPYLMGMANTPKETADNPTQYKNPHETLLKTYFVYLYQGLLPFQVKRMIDGLRSRAFEQAVEGVALSDTESARFFQSLVGDSQYHLCAMTEEDTKNAIPIISKNKTAIFYYIQKYILPQIKIYPQTIVSTVHNFRSQFAGSLSFSATPQDRRAHSVDTHFVPMRGTSGRVTHLLLTKCKDPKTLHPFYSKTPQDALNESLQIAEGNERMSVIIDIGGNFKGLSNLQVAKGVLTSTESDPDVQAILFFDDTDGLFKMMDKSTGYLHLLSESDVDSSLSYTYYDQIRCFGSDIDQAIDAIALMLTSKNTTKAGAGQAAGRMRKWHEGQMVEVAHPVEMERNIKSLLLHWLFNQVKKDEPKNYMSLIQQMDNESRCAIFDQILEKNPRDARRLLGQHLSEFVTEETYDPWELYASLPEEVDTEPYLQSYRQKKNSQIKWDNMLLPPKVQVKSAGIGMECEVLTEQETEQETEVEEQVQATDEKHKRKESKWSTSINLFNRGWERPSRIYPANMLLDAFPKNDVGQRLAYTSLATVLTGLAAVGSAFVVNQIALKCFLAGAGTVAAYAGAQSLMLVKRTYQSELEFFNLSDYFNQYLPKELRPVAAFFSSELLVSKNVYTMITLNEGKPSMGWWGGYTTKTTEEWLPQIPLQRDQKPLFSVLVIKDGTEKLTVALIDQNDSLFLRAKLQQDLRDTSDGIAGDRDRKVGIYDLQHNMFTVEGKNAFTADEIDSPAFWCLIGQVKFLNGDIRYRPKEEEHFGRHLRTKIGELGGEVIRTFFVDHILKNRPANKKAVVRSLEPIWIAQQLEGTHFTKSEILF